MKHTVMDKWKLELLHTTALKWSLKCKIIYLPENLKKTSSTGKF